MESRRIGAFAGWAVYTTATGFSFGCGAERFSREQVKNFFKEWRIRNAPTKKTKQVLDYDRIMKVLNERRVAHRVNEWVANMFERALELPKKRTPVKKAAKKAAPKKKAAKKK